MSRTIRRTTYARRDMRPSYAPTTEQTDRLDTQRQRARNWIARSGIKELDRRESWSDVFTQEQTA